MSDFSSYFLNYEVQKLHVVLIERLSELVDQGVDKVSSQWLKVVEIGQNHNDVFLFLKQPAVANLFYFLMIFWRILKLLKFLYQLIKERSHESVPNQMMESAGKSDVTEEDVKVGFFNLNVEPYKEVDKDRNGVTFGGGEEDVWELSEGNHKVSIREFIEETIHLFSDLILLFLLLSRVSKEGPSDLLSCF